MPARDTVVQDEGFAAITKIAETEMYRLLASRTDAFFCFKTYAVGRELGVNMPIPLKVAIDGWSVGNDEDGIDYHNTKNSYPIDLADATNAAGLTFLGFNDGFVGRAIAQSLEAAASTPDAKLVNKHHELAGYPGYDAITTATIVLHVSDGTIDTRTPIDDSHDLDATILEGAFGNRLPMNDGGVLEVDTLEFEVSTAGGTTVFPANALSLEQNCWDGVRAIVRKNAEIADIALAIHEQTWSASDNDDSDSKDLRYAEVLADLRFILLKSHEATALEIRDTVAQHLLGYLFHQSSTVETPRCNVVAVTIRGNSDNKRTVEVVFDDGVTQTHQI